MGLISGTSSFARFEVLGDLPVDKLKFIEDRVKTFSFNDIDESFDEYSIGWVSILNEFDSKFNDVDIVNSGYITISLRLDERKVPAAVIKKMVRKEEDRFKLEKQVPIVPRSKKAEIKERISTELIRKAIPTPSVIDVCWNVDGGNLLFFSTNKKCHAVLEDFFKETFGLMLRQNIPFINAESMLGEDLIDDLNKITPTVFV